MPGWMFLLGFSIIPLHVTTALGTTNSFLTLEGYGTAAVVLQVISLLLYLIGGIVLMIRTKVKLVYKVAYVPVAYAAIVLITNLFPALISLAHQTLK